MFLMHDYHNYCIFRFSEVFYHSNGYFACVLAFFEAQLIRKFIILHQREASTDSMIKPSLPRAHPYDK